MKFLVLLCMLFLHVVDDFYLQGILAKLKQKKYWKENTPDALYRFDYIVALVVHGFSWSFMVNIPVIVYWFSYGYATNANLIGICIFIIANGVLHSEIDDMKANMHIINLLIDQSAHVAQILVAWHELVLRI